MKEVTNKSFRLIFFILFFPIISLGQNDSIELQFRDFFSKDIIIIDSKENLLKKLGQPTIETIINMSWIDSIDSKSYKEYKKKYDISHIYYEKLGLGYIEIGDSVQLRFIDFKNKRNKNVKIHYQDIVFEKGSAMQDLIDIYNLVAEKDYDSNWTYLVSSESKGYILPFWSNYKSFSAIEFQYNMKKELIYVYFGYCNKGLQPK